MNAVTDARSPLTICASSSGTSESQADDIYVLAQNRLVFGKFVIRTSKCLPVKRSFFHGFSQSLQLDTRIVSLNRPQLLYLTAHQRKHHTSPLQSSSHYNSLSG
jgi:hypothetical protein